MLPPGVCPSATLHILILFNILVPVLVISLSPPLEYRWGLRYLARLDKRLGKANLLANQNLQHQQESRHGATNAGRCAKRH